LQDFDIYVTVALSCAAVLLMACGFLFINYSMNRQKLRQAVKEKELQLRYEQELRDVEAEVRDATMEYIAWELHDNIQHSLTHLRFQVEDLKAKKNFDPEALEYIRETIFEATDQVRSLSNRLKPDFVTANNFVNAFELEISRLRRLERIEVHWQHDGVTPTLSNERLLILFRIFQELLNNVLKHSNAKNVWIELNGMSPLSLRVKDDGKGFEAQSFHRNGRGLQNMQRRSGMGGFSILIKSAPQHGCETVLMELPPTASGFTQNSQKNTEHGTQEFSIG